MARRNYVDGLTVSFEDIGGGKTKLTEREAGSPDVMTGLAGLRWRQSLS